MRALIIGIGGQDGSYLADVLLERGYEVAGIYRHSSVDNLQRIKHIKDKVTLYPGDLLDTTTTIRTLKDYQPDEVYNEADQDNVPWSHNVPGISCDVTAGAVGKLLESVYQTNKDIKVFQPLSATMFATGNLTQNEQTRFNPQSPYACGKVAAYYLCRYYRETKDMFVATAIFFNHDSPRRSEDYLLNKICNSVVRMAKGEQDMLYLGNLATQVDIGFAWEYMVAAHSIMQCEVPDDFVIGTGVGHTIEEWVATACKVAKLDGRCRVGMDTKYYRPGLTPYSVADITKAYRTFGFNPQYQMKELVEVLVRDALCASAVK